MTTFNTDVDFGAGSIPRAYEANLVPLLFEPYARDVARMSRQSDARILETACGSGVVTRALDRTVPESAQITATDFSPGMLDIARSSSASDRITFAQADATALPFESNAFDLVVCQFGVMFFEDELEAYREARRVLDHDGRMIFSTWSSLENNPIPSFLNDQLARIFSGNAPTFFEVPFGHTDIAGMTKHLRDAGFDRIRWSVARHDFRASSAAEIVLAFLSGTPLAPFVAEHADPNAIAERLEAALIERYGDGRIVESMQAFVFEAA